MDGDRRSNLKREQRQRRTIGMSFRQAEPIVIVKSICVECKYSINLNAKDVKSDGLLKSPGYADMRQYCHLMFSGIKST